PIGAMVVGCDMRAEAKDQVAAVGGKFEETGDDASRAGGYEREPTDQERAQGDQVITRQMQQDDADVTTAALLGSPSPTISTEAQIMGMKPGPVIIDLAAEGGGNTPLTVPGETVEVGPATFVAPLNVPSRLAEHVSELYARNLQNLVGL